ncbi:TAXI family TRAP transporter solute-binding subunit [Geosporobacter ferrireducens]|uniref:C4-dicarboxylate ABC transporter substrate-binding protein n=1 Tax=Geosporobacter ferrireducens TaxID=1424294 RepID=A0A1D8GI25_9FIRM|nr:TAXI family TRAP transporter solute-binding subunit [Geosporobacter ferrireducens]AOT70522.1 C4-dicarboxylate ABC transporter substrate-binding protein [Geosporobacter ferrireducens]MTI57122.1 TAXI family TRAP transporter solute-binding subunit [Geosporobacter ferrireducens]
MKRKSILFVALLLVFSLFLTACGGGTSAPADQDAGNTETNTINKNDYFITVATGPTSGLYYPIGGAFSNVIKNKLGYKSSAQSTGASVENINLIIGGKADLAITMSDAIAQAYDAFGAFEGKEPQKNLRVLMSLYPNYVQLVTTNKSGITKFEDLKGKRVGIGAPNSGVELNARMMYEAHGMTYEDSKVDYLNYGEAIDQMKNGLIDAAFVTSGIPNATVMELGTTNKIVIVPIEGEGAKNLIEKYPFFVEEVIPASTYDTDTDVNTVSVRNIMIIREELPEEVVYEITKGIFENIEEIKASHNTANTHLSLENSQIGINIPFHPGAEKYYKEVGIIK